MEIGHIDSWLLPSGFFQE